MSTKPATTRATTATHTGYVQHWMGHNTPFSGRSSRNAAEDDPQPNILQLNTEVLTANKKSIIEQLAYRNNRLSLSSYGRPTAQLQTNQ